MKAYAKRSYHPLVVFFFYSGMLNEEQLASIPYTTRKYWSESEPVELFGYDWVSTFASDQQSFHEISKHKIIFKSARICCRVADCFSVLLSKRKGLNSLLKKNKQIVVTTVDKLAPELTLARACKLFHITLKKFYQWKNEVHCAASVLNLCFRSHPMQLSVNDVSKIKDSVSDSLNQYKPRSSIYYLLMRSEKVFYGVSTFYKYANLTCGKFQRIKTKKEKKSFRATRPFEYLHIDTTFLYSEKSGKCRVAFVKDNFSKAILHCGLLLNGSSQHIRDLLHCAFEKFGLYKNPDPIFIVSDGGSENKGELIKWVNKISDADVTKLIAGKDFPFTNAMSESVHHLYKTFFAPGKIYFDDDHIQRDLDRFVQFVNYEWFPLELYGSAPMEVLNSGVVERGRFSEQIRKARRQRVLENRTFPCGSQFFWQG